MFLYKPSCKIFPKSSIINGECTFHFHFFAGCLDTKEADLYFLIDGSTSIQNEQFEQIKRFMLEVTEVFSIGPGRVQVGVVQYSHEIREEFSIGVYSNDVGLRKAVLNIKQLTGDTHTGAALAFMLPKIREGRKQRPSKVPCYLIVLTDGQSQDHHRILETANRIRAEGVTIHAVGIGEADKTELQQIAGNEERVHFGQNFDSLKSIKSEVVHSICTEKGKQN